MNKILPMNITTPRRWPAFTFVINGIGRKEFQLPLHWLKLSFPFTVKKTDSQLQQGGLIDGYRLCFSQLNVALRKVKACFAIAW
jgi:hypothetical protein